MDIVYTGATVKLRVGPVYADTDKLTDRCSSCRARAGVQYDGIRFRYRCTDCCETGPWDSDRYLAAIAWNLMQRQDTLQT